MNHGDRTLVECGAPIALGVLLFTWACSREPTTRPASSVLTRIAPAKAPSAAHAPPSVVATKLDRASATHLLNRFAFGPSPHDLQQVMELGAQAWFAVQLEPDKLSDVGGDQALAPYKDVLAPPAEIPKRFAKYDMLAEDDGEEVALGARINRDTDFSRV
ncbi:MAG TPA: DUF1800 family protein, partial [Polyangiaceae bacterium]